MKAERPILVVQTAFLGDLLLGVALLREIKRQRPQSPLYLVTRGGLGKLMKALAFADEVREIEKGNQASYDTLIQEFSSLSFEWIFCPHPSFRSKVFVSKLKADEKIGFSNWLAPFFFSKRVSRVRQMPDALRQWSLITGVVPELTKSWNYLKHLNWSLKNDRNLLPSVPKEYSIEARSQILEFQPPTSIAPQTWAIFPGSVWATKQWTVVGFVELAKKLRAQGVQVLWMGGPEEKEICQSLVEAVPESRSLAGSTTLLETLSVLARCEGVVSNDSGGQHLAAVAGVPVLSIFGPTTLDAGFRPWTTFCAIAEYEGLFCRPCGPHGHRQCPRATHECMTQLPAKSVVKIWEGLTREVRLNLTPKTL